MSHKHHNNNPFKNSDIDETIETKKEEAEEKVDGDNEKPSKENSELNALQEKYDNLNQQYLL